MAVSAELARKYYAAIGEFIKLTSMCKQAAFVIDNIDDGGSAKDQAEAESRMRRAADIMRRNGWARKADAAQSASLTSVRHMMLYGCCDLLIAPKRKQYSGHDIYCIPLILAEMGVGYNVKDLQSFGEIIDNDRHARKRMLEYVESIRNKTDEQLRGCSLDTVTDLLERFAHSS